MTDYLNFHGKIAIVTGGRRGLGKAMALALVERGAAVVVISKSAEADELMEEIRNAGGRGYYISADLSKREERNRLIEKACKLAGKPVDILINDAGFQFNETAATCTLEQWDASRSLMLDSYFELSRQAIPVMKENGGGKIINIASICAFREGGGNFSYGVMKSAVVGMTRCMANSVAGFGINVNAIAPGIIRTDLTSQCFTPENYRMFITKYPAHRLGEPKEIAGAMLFLASEMSSFVHGQTLIVDGGFTGN